MDLLVILLLLLSRESITLMFQVIEGNFQVILLLIKSTLDDLSSGQESFLEVLQGFIFDMDSSLLIKHGVGV
jgi:hypothetical protein